MNYNSCVVCGVYFMAEGNGPAFRRCKDHLGFIPEKMKRNAPGSSAGAMGKAREMYEAGYSWTKMEQVTGIYQARIWTVAKREGWKRGVNAGLNPPPAWLATVGERRAHGLRMHAKGQPVREIAAELKVSGATVYLWLHHEKAKQAQR